MAWILRYSPLSPFARKVRISAAVLGLQDKIKLIEADTNSATDSIRQENPLGKIPTLILPDGKTLYDSRVIVEYINFIGSVDSETGNPKPGILGSPDTDRWDILRLQSTADGISEAAVLQRYELVWREESRREPKWMDHQQGKIDRALDALEEELGTGKDSELFLYEHQVSPAGKDAKAYPVNVGQIATACALGYLDLRFEGRWRSKRPLLVDWLKSFEKQIKSFSETAPPRPS